MGRGMGDRGSQESLRVVMGGVAVVGRYYDGYYNCDRSCGHGFDNPYG